ncbi:hypothetical protein [Flavobacterium commune]|uniref:Uncharacterized protein n=1 Tax=Flavobacterium commune TaxID=1306519 RepID=A0A1D9PAL1_9FLAO|nr:hypothetical protein [Flavobacterium commune]AOZ99618.1 hypothetical protein BIW12_09280 [Flavobacterium commune]
MDIANILKKIDLYKTATECLNEIQKLDELEAKPVNNYKEPTPFEVEIYLNKLKRKEIEKLSKQEYVLESKSIK